MARINRIRDESQTTNTQLKSTKNVLIDVDPSNGNIEENNNNKPENYQIDEEKAAAKLFPLNLISNRFKSSDADALKGKLHVHFCVKSF